MIKCNVSNVAIEITETETLTAGRVGLECQFTFSSEWNGLAITAYFLGETTNAVVVSGNTVVVPAASMVAPGYKLYVGVVGRDAQGNIVIPTLWASAGKIKTSPGEEEEPTPSPDVVAQIQLMAINAVNTANAAMQVITDHYEEIEEVGAEQVAAVNAAGTTQTGNVNTAGATQVAAVQAKGEEVLDSIPEDYTTLSNDVSDLKSAVDSLSAGKKTIPTTDIIQGSFYADGSVNQKTDRIRTQGFLALNAGEILHFKPGTNAAQMLYGKYSAAGAYQGDSQWLTTEQDVSFNVDMKLILVFRKDSTNPAITPSQYDATVTISSVQESRLETIESDIDTLEDAVDDLDEFVNTQTTIYPTEIVTGKYIAKNGSENSTPDFVCTPYMLLPFCETESFQVTGNFYGLAGCAIYDKNYDLLLGIDSTNVSTYGGQSTGNIQTITVPYVPGMMYIRISCLAIMYTALTDIWIKGNTVYGAFRRIAELDKAVNTVENILDTTLATAKTLVIGDSISTDSYGSYPKWVTDLIGDGVLASDTVNSSQHATGFVARYNNQANDFITRLKAIENPGTYDLVIIFGGINDYIQNIPMGNETGTDYTVSFKPAVNEFFDYLIENFTQARICVLLPLRTYATWQNSVGEYQQAYGDYIKAVAKSYCLPVLNLTEDSGFYPWKTTFRNMWTLIPEGYEVGDGVHPNEEYEAKYLAPMIKNFLQGLI